MLSSHEYFHTSLYRSIRSYIPNTNCKINTLFQHQSSLFYKVQSRGSNLTSTNYRYHQRTINQSDSFDISNQPIKCMLSQGEVVETCQIRISLTCNFALTNVQSTLQSLWLINGRAAFQYLHWQLVLITSRTINHITLTFGAQNQRSMQPKMYLSYGYCFGIYCQCVSFKIFSKYKRLHTCVIHSIWKQEGTIWTEFKTSHSVCMSRHCIENIIFT